MTTSPLRTVFALVLAAFLVAAPAAQARTLPRKSDVFARIWRFVADFWIKNGCWIDPNGIRYCTSGISDSDPTSENGCRIDPDGQCASEPVATKNGCQIDPNGRCLP